MGAGGADLSLLRQLTGSAADAFFQNCMGYHVIKLRFGNTLEIQPNPLLDYLGPQVPEQLGPNQVNVADAHETWNGSIPQDTLIQVFEGQPEVNGMPAWLDAIQAGRKWFITRPGEEEWIPVRSVGDPQIDRTYRYGMKFMGFGLETRI